MKTRKDIGRMLLKYLDRHDATDAFLRNHNKQERENDLTDFFGAISLSFLWIITPEGHDYWKRLSDSFDHIIDKNAVPIAGFRYEGMRGGFRLGCKEFKTHDVFIIAAWARVSSCERNYHSPTLSSGKSATYLGNGDFKYDGYIFSYDDINALLRVYKKKQIK